MATYEFLYATGGGESCLTTSGYDYDGGCGKWYNDWMYSSNAWFLSSSNYGANYVYNALVLNSRGYVSDNTVDHYNMVLPAVILKSSVTIASGTGVDTEHAYVLEYTGQ